MPSPALDLRAGRPSAAPAPAVAPPGPDVPTSLAAPPGPAAAPRGAWRGLAAGMLLGAVAGAAGMAAADRVLPALPSLGGTAKLLVLAVVVPLALVVLLVHELGHLAAGRLAGFRALLLVVGPLHLERAGLQPGAPWRLRLNRSLAMAGGLASSVPVGDADPESLRRGMLRMVLGGPLASLLLAVAGGAVVAALTARAAPGPAGTIVLHLAVMATLMSAGIALATLVPSRVGGYASDGARVLRLRRGSPVAEREAATVAIVALAMAGTRPGAWPARLIARAAATRPDEGADHAIGQMLAAAHALDGGSPAAGRAHLAAALQARAALPAAARPSLLLEGAWAAAMLDGDLPGARTLRDEAERLGPGLGLAPHQRPLADAAIAWRAGDTAAARQAVAAARAALAQAADPSTAVVARDRLDALEQALATTATA